MNSSTGFKKRNLLRPPSGMRERERQYLRVFDISQSEPMIANQIKTEIIRIQQQINELDKDKKIRTGESSLQKSYISTLKKWLRDALNLQQKQQDDLKVLKYMGVQSYESGFRKLWRFISSLDNLITKITELQIIQLLKYDDTFNELAKDSQKTSEILSTFSKAGFTSGSFQISQVILERNKDLYSLVLQSKRKGNSLFITNQTQKGTNQNEKQNTRKSQTNQLILQLQKQNSKLSSLLEQLDRQKQNNQNLMRELKKKEQIIKENQNILNSTPKSTTSIKSSGSFGDAVGDIQERYKQRMHSLNSQIHKLQTQVSELKIIISTIESKLKISEQTVRQNDPIKGIKVKSGSYEQALLQQMQKMKKGFEKKIEKLLQDFAIKQKDMRKKQLQYRNQNDKVKWQKGLLLKKFDSVQNLAK